MPSAPDRTALQSFFAPAAKRRRGDAGLRDDLERDWRTLCEEIGERRAGSAAERRAVDFIAAQWRAAGLENVRLESFPCTSLRQAQTEVHERGPRGWRRIEAAAIVGAPSTPGHRAVEAELVWLEMPEQSRRLGPRSLRGRILALFGPMPTEPAAHRRLLAAQPAVVIHIDERLPFPWVKNDGVYPYWVRRYGVPPTVTVPYTEAWRWRREGVTRLRVRAAVDQRRARSHNVIAELPGSEPQLPVIALTAHHDTQCDNPGADDNASGVVCLLALARLFAAFRLRRTVRFISFGAEEQLSVGATAYVRRHGTKPSDTGLVLNFDSVASPLGHFTMWVAGTEALARHATRQLTAGGLEVAMQRDITPFFDNFPFNRAGVPSLCFMRSNFPGGRWQHHSRHDTMENVSAAEVRRLLRAAAPLVSDLASRRTWPFPAGLSGAQQAAARRLGRELFGG